MFTSEIITAYVDGCNLQKSDKQYSIA